MELDVKIWKELAIKKQMLMRTVTDSLGLDPDAPDDELKEGILKGVQQIAETETTIAKLESKHRVALADLQEQLKKVQEHLSGAETAIEELKVEKSQLENTVAANRDANLAEVQGLKSQLEAKSKELKKFFG